MRLACGTQSLCDAPADTEGLKVGIKGCVMMSGCTCATPGFRLHRNLPLNRFRISQLLADWTKQRFSLLWYRTR